MKDKNWDSVGWCPVHQKHYYDTRRAARGVCRRVHRGQHKSPFKCETGPQREWFHIGGTAEAVIHGRLTRDEMYRRAA